MSFHHFTELEEGSLFRALAYISPTETISDERMIEVRAFVEDRLLRAAAEASGLPFGIGLPVFKNSVTESVRGMTAAGLVPPTGTVDPVITIDPARATVTVTWEGVRRDHSHFQ